VASSGEQITEVLGERAGMWGYIGLCRRGWQSAGTGAMKNRVKMWQTSEMSVQWWCFQEQKGNCG